ncbi:hypothetical protein ACFQ88_24300 [Paenibacillus sp. NPDC056579]
MNPKRTTSIAGYDFDYLEQKLYSAVIGDVLDELDRGTAGE